MKLRQPTSDVFVPDGQPLGEALSRSIPSVVNRLVGAGTEHVRVRVLPASSSWFGVTYREDGPFVAAGIGKLIRNGEYPERLSS